ncbi:uncharacterized protein LOC128993590 [Macrosteles quadrilineatus]|uniref:uncharacterized protein LOC128993590 n=1 Tax=Macrosteles quadrilineatus TaxID=74068 RepID=UPI0023E29D6D|nr:uncharacterized protein LOC128993590 [Macrosteles quadrilineatus]
MASAYSNLREFNGKVLEVAPKYKAIVQFTLDNKTERALLWYDKLKVDSQPLPEGGSIDDFISKDTVLKFQCHKFDESGVDRCGWYITCAWKQEDRDVALKSNETIYNGLYNCSGTIQEVKKRQGILSYSINGVEENILFLASKMFMSGKRVSAKANLNQLHGIEEGRTIMFDAVPCDPADNDGRCKWFATVVWKGRKPVMEYDDVRNVRNKKQALPQLSDIKSITSNPHSLFLRSEGMVIRAINSEYALAFGSIKKNRWEPVLFHRSAVTLFDLSLAEEDLTTIFQKGDRICFVAAATPPMMTVRWVASKVRPCIDPSVAYKFQF